MIVALGILIDNNGKSVGARLNINGSIKNIKTEQLKEFKNARINNAVIDSRGFIKAKSGNLPRIMVRPNAIQQKDIKEVSKYKNRKITVYHGSKDVNLVPRYGKGKTLNDYGAGFYTTQNIELAKEWAWASYSKGNKGYVYTYEIDLSGLKVLDLTELDSLHWIAELLYNRPLNLDGKEALQDRVEAFIKKYKIDTSEYDVIIGYRADDSYFTYAEDFISSSIYRDTIDNALRYGELGIQIFIKSKLAFSKLVKIGDVIEVPINYKQLYCKRDAKAREKLKEAKRNQNSRNKQTILDFI